MTNRKVVKVNEDSIGRDLFISTITLPYGVFAQREPLHVAEQYLASPKVNRFPRGVHIPAVFLQKGNYSSNLPDRLPE